MHVELEDRKGKRRLTAESQETHEKSNSRVTLSICFYGNHPLFNVFCSQLIYTILLRHELCKKVLKIEHVDPEVFRRLTEQVEALLDDLSDNSQRIFQSLRVEL